MPTPKPRPDPRMLVIGVLGVLAVVGGGLLIKNLGNNGPVGLDQPWHDFLAGNRSVVADWLALGLNAIGGSVGMTVVTALVVTYLLLRHRWLPGISVGVTVILATLASNLVKRLIDRPRPADEILALGANSFPSGHATAAAALAGAIAIAFPRAWTRVAAVAWIVLMAWSRNYLLVHWLSDVAAGAVLGLSIAFVVAGTLVFVIRSRPAASPDHPLAHRGEHHAVRAS